MVVAFTTCFGQQGKMGLLTNPVLTGVPILGMGMISTYELVRTWTPMEHVLVTVFCCPAGGVPHGTSGSGISSRRLATKIEDCGSLLICCEAREVLSRDYSGVLRVISSSET